MAPRSRTESGLHLLLTHLSNLPRKSRHGRSGGDRHLSCACQPRVPIGRSIVGGYVYKQTPGKHLTDLQRLTVSGLVPHACVKSLHLVTLLHCSIGPLLAGSRDKSASQVKPILQTLQFCSLTRTSSASQNIIPLWFTTSPVTVLLRPSIAP